MAFVSLLGSLLSKEPVKSLNFLFAKNKTSQNLNNIFSTVKRDAHSHLSQKLMLMHTQCAEFVIINVVEQLSKPFNNTV